MTQLFGLKQGLTVASNRDHHQRQSDPRCARAPQLVAKGAVEEIESGFRDYSADGEVRRADWVTDGNARESRRCA